jgi:hypothetical protein
MTVPAGIFAHAPENVVAVSVPTTELLPVIAAPPDDTVNVLLTPSVPVTELLPVIPAPPDDTVRPPDDTVTPD